MAAVLGIAMLVPFMINMMGWSIFAYLNLGDRDLVLGASLGTCYLANAEHLGNDIAYGYGVPNDYLITILDSGPLDLFLEKRIGDSMTPFSFRLTEPDQYIDIRAIEFPWLLLLFVPVTLWLAAGIGKNAASSRAELAG